MISRLKQAFIKRQYPLRFGIILGYPKKRALAFRTSRKQWAIAQTRSFAH